MAIISADWSAATTYAIDDLANFNGVVYRALAAITGSDDNNNPCEDTTNWIVSHVVRAEDWNGIIEAVKQELNTDIPRVNNSIPYFIQMAEQSFYTRIRPSSDLVSTLLTIQNIPQAGYEGRIYIPIPADLLNVENMRINSDSGVFYGLLSMGRLEIKATQSDYDFEVVRQLYQDNDSVYGSRTLTNYNSAVYRFRTIGGISYFELAPSAYEVGMQVELSYYRSEPSLGTRHPRINGLGQPVNDRGQNLAAYLADTTVLHTAATATITIPTGVAVAGDSLTVRTVVLGSNGVRDEDTTTLTLAAGNNQDAVATDFANLIRASLDPLAGLVSVQGNVITVSSTSLGSGARARFDMISATFAGAATTLSPTSVNGGPEFEQQIVTITRNWFTSQVPHLIIYGALVNASAWLKNDQRTVLWDKRFKEAEEEAKDLIYRFEEVRPTEVQMYSSYSY